MFDSPLLKVAVTVTSDRHNQKIYVTVPLSVLGRGVISVSEKTDVPFNNYSLTCFDYDIVSATGTVTDTVLLQ